MDALRAKFRALWIRLVRMGRTEDEFEAELECHVTMHTEDGIRAGLSPKEARRQALIKLGGQEQARQAYRERATLALFESVLQDVRFALRQMAKAPGFTITAVLTLALGIGANTVIYTLVDSILLRPLPFAHQERLVRIVGSGTDGNTSPFPKGWIRELNAHSHALGSVAAFGSDAESNLSDSDVPDRVFGAAVSVNAFDTLGIHPALGDFFSADDAIAGQAHDVVLSYGYWRQHYDGSQAVLGHTIRIDGVSRRIIGVIPAGVRFPYSDTQFVIPISYRRGDPLEPWKDFNLQAFGRLADGVTPGQAQAELRGLNPMLLTLFPWRMPDSWAAVTVVEPLLQSVTGDIRPRLLLLFGAVGLILLIACANVANLTLARATAREREIAIRGAVGASARRLVQQLISESVVLGITAGIVGLAAAFASMRIFLRLLPADTPRVQDISLHPADAFLTLGASVLAGLLFGFVPSIRMASVNLLPTLRAGGRGVTGKGATFGVSMALVIAQIGLSVMVITAAGLMLHSLYNLSQVDPGFQTEHIVTAEVSLDGAACNVQGRCRAFFEALLDRAQGIAGVNGAALTDTLPLNGSNGSYVFDAEGHPRSARQNGQQAAGRIVSPGYFDAIGLRLLRGRLLDPQDASGATHAVVVNEHLVHRLWPNQNPIGKHLLALSDEPAPGVWVPEKASIVVGVVRDSREGSLEGNIDDQVFLPMTPEREVPVMYVLLPSHRTPSDTAADLRRAVASIDSLVPVTRVRSMDEVVASSVAAPRALAVLLLGFGGLAVVIGAVGVYSLIAYIVSWRTREIGVRLALGAQRWQIVAALIRQSLMLAAGGCLAGLLGGLSLSRALRSFLFEVSALDPITFCAVAVLMFLVALLASWIPARRAASVDPMVALRGD
jgi:predicted permease